MTRLILAGLTLGALLVAFGCDGVFVLGDVASSPETTGGSDGSGGSGESDSTLTAGGVGGGLEGDAAGPTATGNAASGPATSTGGSANEAASATGSGTTSATVGGMGAATSVGTDGGGGASGETGDGDTTGCSPGPDPAREEECCSTGTRTRSVGYDAANCEYVLGQWGECSVEGVCAPGDISSEIGHCTNGRWRDRTRTCSDICEWGEWIEGECQGDASACTGCACTAWCTDPDTGGSTCLWIACSEAEARLECDQEIVEVCGIRKDPFTFREWLPN